MGNKSETENLELIRQLADDGDVGAKTMLQAIHDSDNNALAVAAAAVFAASLGKLEKEREESEAKRRKLEEEREESEAKRIKLEEEREEFEAKRIKLEKKTEEAVKEREESEAKRIKLEKKTEEAVKEREESEAKRIKLEKKTEEVLKEREESEAKRIKLEKKTEEVVKGKNFYLWHHSISTVYKNIFSLIEANGKRHLAASSSYHIASGKGRQPRRSQDENEGKLIFEWLLEDFDKHLRDRGAPPLRDEDLKILVAKLMENCGGSLETIDKLIRNALEHMQKDCKVPEESRVKIKQHEKKYVHPIIVFFVDVVCEYVSNYLARHGHGDVKARSYHEVTMTILKEAFESEIKQRAAAEARAAASASATEAEPPNAAPDAPGSSIAEETPSKPLLRAMHHVLERSNSVVKKDPQLNRFSDCIIGLSTVKRPRLNLGCQLESALSLDGKKKGERDRNIAIGELEQDLIKSGRKLMIGVFADGKSWTFVSMKVVKVGSDFKVETKRTRPIDALRETRTLLDFLIRTVLAYWHSKSDCESFYSYSAPKLELGALQLVPVELLAYHKNKNIVMRCKYTCEATDYLEVVMKMPALAPILDSERKQAEIMKKELAKWSLVSEDQWGEFRGFLPLRIENRELQSKNVLCTLYCGWSLSQYLPCCDYYENANQLACRIFEEVGNALCALHDQEYCFVDLHPGNILVQTKNEIRKGRPLTASDVKSIKLVDIESITKIKKNIESKFRYYKFQPDSSTVSSYSHDWKCLILVLAAIIDYNGKFRDLQARREESTKTVDLLKKEILGKTEPILREYENWIIPKRCLGKIAEKVVKAIQTEAPPNDVKRALFHPGDASL